MRLMNPGQLRIRRATLDDLPALKSLWLMANLPAAELENRLTEFHLVENNGALGVEVLRQHARIHSEDYADFSVADAARELFGERLQVIAANLGIFRLWTLETSPFWKRWGFQPPNAETLARLPEEWNKLEGNWLTLELKNEDAINAVMNEQLAGFLDTEKKQTERVAQRARNLRLIITIAGFGFFFLCVAVAVFLLLRRPIQIR